MANTKVPVELSSTPGIVDNSNATAITIDSNEDITIGGKLNISTGTNGTPTINLSHTNANADNFRIACGVTGVANSGLSIYDVDATATRFVIDSSGNVGIGLTNPSAYGKLAVSGTATQLALNASSGKSRIGFFEAGTGRFYIDTLNGADGLAFVDADGSTERMRIDSSGNVGIGSTPSTTIRNDGHATEKGLQVGRAAMIFSDSGLTTDLQNNSHLNNSDQRVAMTGTLSASLYGQYNGQHTWYTAPAVAAPNVQSMTARMSLDISGNLVVNQNITAYGTPSDIKLKENIEVIDNALDKVKQLKGITYDLKSDGNRLTGLIAQDLEKVLPEAVYTSKTIVNEKEGEVAEEHLAIRYGNTVGLLVEAIKELEARVKELEGK